MRSLQLDRESRIITGNRNRFHLLMKLAILIILIINMSVSADNIKSVKSGKWSNPATWNTGQIPGSGDNVLVDSDHVVIYDANSNEEIRLVHIRGKLTFSRTVDTQLDAGMIILSASHMVDVNANCSFIEHEHGHHNGPRPTLEVGTFDNPIPHNITAKIRLIHFPDMDPDCAPGLLNYGGRMEIHGSPINHTWVKLAKSAMRGDNTIELSESVDWQVGDHIIITRSNEPGGNSVSLGTFRTNGMQETEERYISAISGNRITLNTSLNEDHPRWKNKFAGEVANLSRNVVISSKDPEGVRGHTMYHHGSLGSISYAEFAHLGKAGKLARYPIHFHILKNTMRGSSVIGASIWDSHNRFVTVHGTNYMLIRDCVGYKSLGHGFFMEDATEINNLFDNNLAVLAFDTDPLPRQALPYDQNDGAGYWWANGRNAFIDNVAVECDDYGFRFEVPEDVFGDIIQPDGSERSDVQINTLSFIRFKGNEIHSTLKYGYRGDGNVSATDPLVFEDLKIWNLWYSFRPDMNNYYIKNFEVWSTAYGFYGRSPGNGRVENYTATNPGNYAMGFQEAPEGLITFENVTVDSSGEYPFRIYGKDPRDEDCEIHVRNFKVTNTSEGYNGAKSKNPESNPELTLYLHDWFGPGQDAKVIPSNQSRSDGLSYSAQSPEFNGVKVAQTSVAFPANPIQPDDNLPPATVIIYPANEQVFSGSVKQITVLGTCIDASNISSVRVNGKSATPLAENYRQWQVTLTDLSPGEISIVAEGKDEFGNKELTPHKINIGIGVVPTGTGDDDNPPSSNDDPGVIAEQIELLGNFPNPFNPETQIKFMIANTDEASQVSLTVYDLLGNKVRSVYEGALSSGEYSMTWDATDDSGRQMTTGVYFYELTAVSPESERVFKQARKMLLVR